MAWLQLNTDTLDDEIMAKLTGNQYRIYIYLMLLACEEEHGVITKTHEEIAWRLRIPIKQIQSAITRLERLYLISTDNNTISFLFSDEAETND